MACKVVFVIDTSASMNQRAANGMSFLDAAKSAVERFLALRMRDAAARNDKYMLVTCAEGPACVRVGWKDSYSAFVNEVKNLRAYDLTNLGPSLRRAFDLLNVSRLTHNIDTFGLVCTKLFSHLTVVQG